MASYNRVMLMGNLTRDIEMRYLPSGMAVVEVGLAVNEKRKNHDGQWVDDVNFFDIVMYGRTAEIAGEYLSKGSPVFVEGRLKQETWEKEGQKRSKVRVVCERMQMLGSKDRPAGSGESISRGSSVGHTDDEHSHDSSPPRPAASRPSPRREPQPTGDGPGYEEAEIPF